MDIDKLKVWEPPTKGYGIISTTTFDGEFFTLSTGKIASTLHVKGGYNLQKVTLEGEVVVDNEGDCWKIADKFMDINEVVRAIARDSFCKGRNSAKKQLRDWLELEELLRWKEQLRSTLTLKE